MNKMFLKAFIFGAEGVGKTELCKKLTKPQYTNKPHQKYSRTIGPDFNTIEIPDIEGIKKVQLNIWETSGNPKLKNNTPFFLPGSNFGLFCIDLSKPVDQQIIKELNDDLATFREANPAALLILVGTKRDEALPNALENAKQQFEQIPFISAVSTSARETNGALELVKVITLETPKIAQQKQEEELKKAQELINDVEQRKTILHARNRCTEDSDVYRALDKLNLEAKDLSPETIKALGIETNSLLDKLEDPTIDDKEPCFKTFIANCNRAVKGTHYELKSALLTLVYAAAVTVIAAVIGFGIGFALGSWSGPGAFFTGLAAGSASAVSVAVGSSLSGAGTLIYSAHHFFKTTPVLSSINQVAEHANDKDLNQFNNRNLVD
ncbi:Rab family GTPase [Legionella quateirensis]|nr:hypothetical protein [Legionella quateirensis]